MASRIIFTILKRSRDLTTNAILTVRSYSTGSHANSSSSSRNLFLRISPLGDPSLSVVPVLDQWVLEGKTVKTLELQRIVRDLRARRRYKQALEVSEWMTCKGLCSFSPGDRAVQLDLIGRVHGLDSAESYFNNLSDQDKIDKIYGALLNCLCQGGAMLTSPSLSHVQKMKDMGFAFTPLFFYNDIMCLYTNTGQIEKVPDVLSEMKENGVSPDQFSYRICINSYGARSDLKSMEKVLEEMERIPNISMGWATYAMVANYYIKASMHEKALVYLKKCEEKVNKDALGYNNLISFYASLGNKDEMMRLWGLEKSKCKRQINRDYITMLGSLVKLGELEESEKLLEEWESSCYCYDFRVPNTLLIGYSQKGLIEKAEAILRGIVNKGKIPTPNSWAILAAGYVDKQDMEKAFECMKEALAVWAENKGWRPKAKVILSILNWLSDYGDVEEVEAFLSSFKTIVPLDREMYHVLIKAYIKGGKEVDGLLESMKADKIDENEETKTILSSRQGKS
uniref:Pentacotripeptide-repeat region of PRORP domain-containing protein n=1 Tax=Fagus sylvatica TaxID=28930 RepID=A0A2N9FF87_FAGSY